MRQSLRGGVQARAAANKLGAVFPSWRVGRDACLDEARRIVAIVNGHPSWRALLESGQPVAGPVDDQAGHPQHVAALVQAGIDRAVAVTAVKALRPGGDPAPDDGDQGGIPGIVGGGRILASARCPGLHVIAGHTGAGKTRTVHLVLEAIHAAERKAEEDGARDGSSGSSRSIETILGHINYGTDLSEALAAARAGARVLATMLAFDTPHAFRRLLDLQEDLSGLRSITAQTLVFDTADGCGGASEADEATMPPRRERFAVAEHVAFADDAQVAKAAKEHEAGRWRPDIRTMGDHLAQLVLRGRASLPSVVRVLAEDVVRRMPGLAEWEPSEGWWEQMTKKPCFAAAGPALAAQGWDVLPGHLVSRAGHARAVGPLGREEVMRLAATRPGDAAYVRFGNGSCGAVALSVRHPDPEVLASAAEVVEDVFGPTPMVRRHADAQVWIFRDPGGTLRNRRDYHVDLEELAGRPVPPLRVSVFGSGSTLAFAGPSPEYGPGAWHGRHPGRTPPHECPYLDPESLRIFLGESGGAPV